MTGFPASKLTELLDPIAEAWKAVNPRHPLPKDLGGPGGASRPLPDPPGSLRDKPLVESDVQTPAPSAVQDAELDGGKFLGKPCPHGHRVRYCSSGQCVMCLRAAVKRCNDRDRQGRAA